MVKAFVIFFIRVVSNSFRAGGIRACRFYPSCSEYSVEAFKTLSMSRAFYLMIKRILSCHPFSAGGYDPLPEINSTSHFKRSLK